MSILIKGIDLPKEGETTFIAIKGKTAIETYKGINIGYYSAIQIDRPHGRLIDEDEIFKRPHCGECNDATLEAIEYAPTILEAEE